MTNDQIKQKVLEWLDIADKAFSEGKFIPKQGTFNCKMKDGKIGCCAVGAIINLNNKYCNYPQFLINEFPSNLGVLSAIYQGFDGRQLSDNKLCPITELRIFAYNEAAKLRIKWFGS